MKKRNRKAIYQGSDYARLAAAIVGSDGLSNIALFTARSVTLMTGLAYIEICENRGAAAAERFLRWTLDGIARTINRIRA